MYGGESREDLTARARDFLELVRTQEHKTVAAFSHWGFIGTVLDQVFGIRLPKNKLVCKNCTVCVLTYENDMWRLHSWINPQTDTEESI